MKRRHIKSTHYVWCDFHCEIHVAEEDWYQEGSSSCAKPWWRPVYVLGEPEEEF